MSTDPWPAHRCTDNGTFDSQIDAVLTDTLADAEDERPLQTFFAAHPHLLRSLLLPGNSAWCFDRPRFGAELIPDFLLCTHSSSGYLWVMVELESPRKAPLTAAGLPSRKLNEALAQIRDWRAWLRANIAYAQTQLRFTDIDAECLAFVVIGRRSHIPPNRLVQYRELTTSNTIVMTYDRLVDSIRTATPT